MTMKKTQDTGGEKYRAAAAALQQVLSGINGAEKLYEMLEKGNENKNLTADLFQILAELNLKDSQLSKATDIVLNLDTAAAESEEGQKGKKKKEKGLFSVSEEQYQAARADIQKVMDGVEGCEKLLDLLEKGKKKGKLSSADFTEALDSLDLESEQMDKIYDVLQNLGVDITGEDDPGEVLPDDSLPTIEEIEDMEELPEEEIVDPNTLVDSFSIDDPVRMYLKEIGKVELLTSDQEVELARAMVCGMKAQAVIDGIHAGFVLDGEQAGRELEALGENADEAARKELDRRIYRGRKSLNACPNLQKLSGEEKYAELQNLIKLGEETWQESSQDEDFLPLNDIADDKQVLLEKLSVFAKAGERAKKNLAEANLRLVVSIAKRYVGRGMLFLDLIQEGNLGLIKAVEKFDYNKGFKFSTYATWWIRQAITRAIADQARTIRIPVHMVETINKVIRVSRQLLQEVGHDPTPEEIAEEMDMPVEKVREILKIAQEPVSLETPIGEEEDSHLGDFIPDEDASEPSEAASFTLLKEQLVEVLSTLTPREEKVLKLRFGIEDGRTRTLEEVGKEFNVTRERIRQIEAKALRKLRHPSRSKKLKDFLN